MVNLNPPSVFGVPTTTKGTQGTSTSTFTVPGSTATADTGGVVQPTGTGRLSPLFAPKEEVQTGVKATGRPTPDGYTDWQAKNAGKIADHLASYTS